MSSRLLVLLLSTAAIGLARPASAQAPGDRVRVHLLGLVTIEDTVMGWRRDSLIGVRTLAAPRGQIVSIDVWRRRSFRSRWMRYSGTSTGLLSIAAPALGVPRLMVVGAGFGAGFVAAAVHRLVDHGDWVPLAGGGGR